MSSPRVVAVAPGSPAESAGLHVGDRVEAINGQAPRDFIQWQLLTDEPELELDVPRKPVPEFNPQLCGLSVWSRAWKSG